MRSLSKARTPSRPLFPDLTRLALCALGATLSNVRERIDDRLGETWPFHVTCFGGFIAVMAALDAGYSFW